MGADLDLDLVPLREQGLEPFEILTSESQERMLAIVAPERLDAVREVCERWGLASAVIATLVTGGMLTVRHHGDVIACVPASALASDGPEYERPMAPEEVPETHDDPAFFPFDGDLHDALIAVLSSPNVASKRWWFEQYDSIVQGQTLRPRTRTPRSFAYRGLSRASWSRPMARPVRSSGSLHRGHARGGRGGAERCRHGSPAARHHELHELRQPGTGGRDVAVRRVDPRDA